MPLPTAEECEDCQTQSRKGATVENASASGSTPREQALQDVYDEARRLSVDIRTGAEAEAFLDWAAQAQGLPSEQVHAAAIGDVIMVRHAHAANVRLLREELIHVHQQRAGMEVSRTAITAGELAARSALIRHRHQWGLTHEEIREVIQEIRHIRRTGRY